MHKIFAGASGPIRDIVVAERGRGARSSPTSRPTSVAGSQLAGEILDDGSGGGHPRRAGARHGRGARVRGRLMAKALECPACGAKHRLDGLEPSTTFRCERVRTDAEGADIHVTTRTKTATDGEPGADGSPAASAAAAASGSDDVADDLADVADGSDDAADGAAGDNDGRAEDGFAPDVTATETAAPMALAAAAVPPPPPPRRRAPGAPRGREIVGASATISVSDGDGAAAVAAPAPEREPAKRKRVHWYWRIVAWIVAVPLGFVITVWPAYEFGLISKDDVLDVFVGSGTGRYTRLAIVTLIWALVTALLVQLFVEGGRWWAARRRQRRDRAPQPSASAAAS